MTKEIQYIKKVEISKLWGKYDISWNLHPDVNILAGANGSGKSTILNCIFSEKAVRNGVKVAERIEKTFNINIYTQMPEDEFISTFDKELKQSEAVKKLSDDNVKTELDWEIYQLQNRYLSYQLNISRKKDQIVDNNNSENISEAIKILRKPQNRFLEIMDTLFQETGKKINRAKNEITFLLDDEIEITPYQLSSGEKQILVILLTTLIQDNQPSILFLDEPEISLHVEWQKKLIGYIRELNPNVQVIIATHSPALIMDGWLDKVTNISDIITKTHKL
jgi:predicted ATPase